jgi:gamma-glutamylcyclotransferase (GGCT)/AIG2-like uncharacterized protein YtfP
MIRMFLNGGAMRGGNLHHLLLGAPLIGAVRSAPRYRFYSVRDEFPGMQPAAGGGRHVDGELYELSEEVLRDSLLPAEPPELELGVIELEDGSASFAMILRAGMESAPGVTDISGIAWRDHLAGRGR